LDLVDSRELRGSCAKTPFFFLYPNRSGIEDRGGWGTRWPTGLGLRRHRVPIELCRRKRGSRGFRGLAHLGEGKRQGGRRRTSKAAGGGFKRRCAPVHLRRGEWRNELVSARGCSWWRLFAPWVLLDVESATADGELAAARLPAGRKVGRWRWRLHAGGNRVQPGRRAGDNAFYRVADPKKSLARTLRAMAATPWRLRPLAEGRAQMGPYGPTADGLRFGPSWAATCKAAAYRRKR
jgi:hypothetical protein